MAGNRAVGPTSLGNITGIVEGAALTPFGTEDLLLVDLTPNVGGAGFTVGYVADITDPGPGGQSNRIPATPPGTPTTCPLNELLVVSFGPPPQQPFSRGDADGNRKLNVTDGILIIQIRIGNIAARFNCDDILDSNDNGIVELSDAVLVLRYVFMDGAPLPPPFRAQCTTDPTDDALICAQGNCTPGA
jgi:hypothetical protein